jgi:hypothetical protein
MNNPIDEKSPILLSLFVTFLFPRHILVLSELDFGKAMLEEI